MNPPPPSRLRESNPLRTALIVTLVAAVVLGIIYVRVHKRRSALLGIQQACLGYASPAGKVVYEENSTRAAELLTRSREYSPVPTGDSGPPIAGHVPPMWRAMMGWISPSASPPADAVLFLHERQTQLGKRGLICVRVDRVNRRLRVTFVHPGASTLDPVPIPDVTILPRPQEGIVRLSAGEDPLSAKLPKATDDIGRADLRFFSAQIDPTDPSHWIMPYEFEDRAGELEMWLQDERTIHYIDRRFAFSVPRTTAPSD
jgi:hypothetical protein